MNSYGLLSRKNNMKNVNKMVPEKQKCIMIQGTASNAGKSVLVAAL